MAMRVNPPVEEEKAEVDGVEEAEGVSILVRGHFGRSQASLHLIVVASMSHITEKRGDSR